LVSTDLKPDAQAIYQCIAASEIVSVWQYDHLFAANFHPPRSAEVGCCKLLYVDNKQQVNTGFADERTKFKLPEVVMQGGRREADV
jgi:hypothetical protein